MRPASFRISPLVPKDLRMRCLHPGLLALNHTPVLGPLLSAAVQAVDAGGPARYDDEGIHRLR